MAAGLSCVSEGICGLQIWAVLLVITSLYQRTPLSLGEWEKLIPLVSFPSLWEPLGLQEGLTQRQVESKGSFPAKRKSLCGEDATASLPPEQLGFVASGDTTGEHQERTGFSILRNCTFPLTFTSVSFQHRRRIREEKSLSQALGTLFCLFVSLWEKKGTFLTYGEQWGHCHKGY